MESKLENRANASIKGIITTEIVSKEIDKMAKELSKTVNIAGFRKGKVPSHIIKTRFKEKLQQDSEQEALRNIYENALKELEIDADRIIGEPRVTLYERKEDGSIETEIKIDIRPEIEIEGYKEIVPEIAIPEITEEEYQNRLNEILKSLAELKKVEDRDVVEKGDTALIDFEGFINGKAFEGGKAEAYPLEIGSGSFIPGFEEQIIGMKVDEERDIKVKFPDNYNSKELAGKEATFKVKLLEIQTKVVPTEVTNEIAKKILPNEENPTPELVEKKIKEQLALEKKHKIYMEEIKPKYIDALIEKFEFDLPEGIVDKELDFALNNRLNGLSDKEFEEYKNNKEKIAELREELKDDAKNSVKLTFIVDQIAKAENIEVSDQEVQQTIMYESYRMGQDPQKAFEEYQKQGLLPAVKMSLIEDKLFVKLFDEKLEG